MTPKEKAQELFDKYFEFRFNTIINAKKRKNEKKNK